MSNQETALFGKWIKARREALDFTQKELAYAVGCSVSTIRKMETGERRPSRQVAELLAEHLEIEPEELERFIRFARAGEGGGLKSAESSEQFSSDRQNRLYPSSEVLSPTDYSQPQNNLPAPITSFVGRKSELTKVRQLLWRIDTRLLTLTGPGGTGKTRLALQVAASMTGEFADGIFFVGLAALTDPALVPNAIAQTLGLTDVASRVPPLEHIKEYISDKRLLLVLDNFEQLVEAAPAVDTLLRAAPNLKVLVTSRAPLHIYGEREFLVPPLEVSADTRPGAEPGAAVLAESDAVRLFVERAQAVKLDFALTPENSEAVFSICARLDGLPLAIELAAARVKFLSPAVLLTRLSSRLDTLTGGPTGLPPRHRTLRGAISWSYDLLDRGEQELFRRLSVFQGGRALDGVREVCGGTDGIESLVDKSLVQLREGEDGETRFWMLETIHEYAREKLEESEEWEGLSRRHAAYFLALAEMGEKKLQGAEQPRWLARLEVEQDNMRSALNWAVQHGDGETALRLASALALYWRIRSHLAEGREWLKAALTLSGSRAVRAKALCAAGELAIYQDDYAVSRGLITESLSIAREIGSKRDTAAALYSLGRVASYEDDYVTARAALEESLTLWEELGDRWNLATAINGLAYLANRQGDWRTHHGLVRQAVGILRELGDKWALARSLNNLGVSFRVYIADYAEARKIAEETLGLCRELGDKLGTGLSLSNLGTARTAQGDLRSARLYLDQALAVFQEIGLKQKLAETYALLSAVVCLRGEYRAAENFAEQGLRVGEGIGARAFIAHSLLRLGMAAGYGGQYDRAVTLLEWSEAVYKELGPMDVTEPGLEEIATVVRWRGRPEDLERAGILLEKALAWRNAQDSGGSKVVAAGLLYEQGLLGWQLGRGEETEHVVREALTTFSRFGCLYNAALCISALAGRAALEGQAGVRAAALCGAASALYEVTGGEAPQGDMVLWKEPLAAARGAIGEEKWQAAFERGASMTPESAIAFTLEGGSSGGQ